MISDQRQTGVPNAKSFTGSSGRTQLVKPNQVTNVGRSLPQNQNLAPALANTQQTQVQQATPTFNPVYPQAQTQTAQYDLLAQAKADMAQQGQTTATTAVRPQTQSMNDYLKAQAQNPNGAQLAAQVTQEAEQLVQDKDIARQAIRKMKSTDIIELLDELANGTLTGAD